MNNSDRVTPHTKTFFSRLFTDSCAMIIDGASPDQVQASFKQWVNHTDTATREYATEILERLILIQMAVTHYIECDQSRVEVNDELRGQRFSGELLNPLSGDINEVWFITIWTILPNKNDVGPRGFWSLKGHEKYRATTGFIYSLAHAFRERAGTNQVVAVSKEDGTVDYAFIGQGKIDTVKKDGFDF